MSDSFLQFKEFRAWIEVDGQVTECLLPHTDFNKGEVGCWIVSEVGKTFSIAAFKDASTPYDTRITAYIDGFRVAGSFGRKDEVARHTFRYYKTSNKTKRPFIFSRVPLTGVRLYAIEYKRVITIPHLGDGEANLDDSKSENKPGEIRVVVKRITKFKPKSPEPPVPRTRNFFRLQTAKKAVPEEQKMDETLYKGMTFHQVKFGKEIFRKKSFDRPKYTFREGEVLVTFVVQYRPLGTLQAAGIIAHPSPSPITRPLASIIVEDESQAGAPHIGTPSAAWTSDEMALNEFNNTENLHGDLKDDSESDELEYIDQEEWDRRREDAKLWKGEEGQGVKNEPGEPISSAATAVKSFP
ncbi:unnamed protein product [Cyclocybe aegerita]|uniref:DUF7918 domain-containing protein n=1 Tax=Cyclocybe aegerita TaxID=1973307 RepID=A0A8S0W436_CYCAE|nr:unnamed protein product [Cyclocybe aegerita]